eukprot:TRINITY_DN1863_c0_g1_i1.p1 TRINITY_DN1863_c0_g1~~TRINITY_DN1863_c0_g1_i1.p1  ORF type:complete len:1949 (+),score=644.05 TRINITY_DN1863_c0_g1_i1:310-5847(+)
MYQGNRKGRLHVRITFQIKDSDVEKPLVSKDKEESSENNIKSNNDKTDSNNNSNDDESNSVVVKEVVQEPKLPNQLILTIISCADLPRGSILDRTDALCLINVGKAKFRTVTMDNNWNPVWNETFKFNVTNGERIVGLRVMDEDIGRDDFLGRLDLPVSRFHSFSGDEVVLTLPLLNKSLKKDKKSRGTITLSGKWHYVETAISEIDGKIEEESAELSDDSDDYDVDAAVQAASLIEEQEKQEEERRRSGIIVKKGDYQVQVHVIEVRDLKPEDANGLSDPVCIVKCLDQKASTRIHKKCLSCVFDEVLFLNRQNASLSDLESAVIDISVYDADGLTRSDLIGCFQFDLMNVYYRKYHEVYEQWVALYDPEDGDDQGIQGYLRLSVTVLGPGDRKHVHAEHEDVSSDEEGGENDDNDDGDNSKKNSGSKKSKVGGSLMNGLKGLSGKKKKNAWEMNDVMMPPMMQKEMHFLSMAIHKAEDLPKMDSMITGGGIDAYCKVDFAGNPTIRTQRKKGQGSRLSCEWREDLWMPVMVPTMTSQITMQVWDYDRGQNDDLVATSRFSFDDVRRWTAESAAYKKALKDNKKIFGGEKHTEEELEGMKPSEVTTGARWISLYGAPKGIEFGKNKKRMNHFPDFATTYRGRVLVSMKEIYHFSKKCPKQPHKRRAKPLPESALPETQIYLLRALIVSGTNLPVVKELTRKMGLSVKVSIGPYILQTASQPNVSSTAEWKQLLEENGLVFPKDVKQIPDIFVYLCKGGGNSARNICYSRYKAADVLKNGFNGEAKWVHLIEDPAINALADCTTPGSILMRMGFGPSEESNKVQWDDDLSALDDKVPCQVRVHMYQARNLPSADSNGLMDPYARIRLGMQEVRLDIQEKTTNPQWYTTKILDLNLPRELKWSPLLSCSLWDYDKFSADDMAGTVNIQMSDSEVMVDRAEGIPLNQPKWHQVKLQQGEDTGGTVLMSVEVFHKDLQNPSTLTPPKSIQPEMRKAYVDIVTIGVRDMASYQYSKIYNPRMEYNVGDGEHIFTHRSKTPNGPNANFLKRILIPVDLPENPLYCPHLNIAVRDSRLGGFKNPIVARTSLDLASKLPWSKNFVATEFGDLANSQNVGHNENIPTQENTPSDNKENSEPVVNEENNETASHINTNNNNNINNDLDMFRGLVEEEGEGVEESKISDDDTPTNNPDQIEIDMSSVIPDTESEKLGTSQKESKGGWSEIPEYLQDREIMPAELENTLTSPFEIIPLFRGQALGRGTTLSGKRRKSTKREVGKLRCIIRVVTDANEPFPVDLDKLLKPKDYKIRLYCLRGVSLQPMDDDGTSDVYLKVKLGKQVFSDMKKIHMNTTEPQLYQTFDFTAKLPGASRLLIKAMDYDTLSKDDSIGNTIIDLEERWFSSQWQKLGMEHETETRYRPKPVERRALFAKTSTVPQGTLEMWVDILTEQEAVKYPLIDITPPPPEIFELRCIVWKTKEVISMDTVTNQNDMYAKCWVEGLAPQETDVHLRCKKGKGSWNWRMKWDVALPDMLKFPYFHLQLWDKDLLKYNDCIADKRFDLKSYFLESLRTKKTVNVFRNKKRKKDDKKKAKAIEDEKKAAATTTTQNPIADQVTIDMSSDKPKDGGGELLDEESNENEKTPLLKAPEKPPGQEDAADMLNGAREFLGMGPEPEDAIWLKLMNKNWETGKMEKRGQVLVSMEIIPKQEALSKENGFGRNEPNVFPRLPPPVGRMHFSLNPIYILKELLGPELFYEVCCFLCVLLVVAAVIGAFILGGPFIGFIMQWWGTIPAPLNLITVGLMLSVMCCVCCCCCYQVRKCKNKVTMKKKPDYYDGEDDKKKKDDKKKEKKKD